MVKHFIPAVLGVYLVGFEHLSNETEAESNRLETHISLLRKKLVHLPTQASIRTVRHVGYVLRNEKEGAKLFHKLRNAMLLFNLSVTGAVIVAAFVAIYWSTSSKVLSDIDSKLQSLPTVGFSLGEDGITEHVEVEVSDSLSPIGSIVVQTSEMFSLDIDSKGGIVAVHSTFGLSDHVYELAAREALNQKSDRSPISWQGRQWRYTIAQTKLDNNVPYMRASSPVEASHKITFLDVTESYASLTRLRITLLSVGGTVLIALFLSAMALRTGLYAPFEMHGLNKSNSCQTPRMN